MTMSPLRRPLAAVALLAVLASSPLALAEAASSGRTAGRHGRREATRGAASTTVSIVQSWVARLLAEVGLGPTQAPKTGDVTTAATQSSEGEIGAGIDPNG